MQQSISITGCVRGRSVGWSVMHLFDDSHVAPYWPTWPCLEKAWQTYGPTNKPKDWRSDGRADQWTNRPTCGHACLTDAPTTAFNNSHPLLILYWGNLAAGTNKEIINSDAEIMKDGREKKKENGRQLWQGNMIIIWKGNQQSGEWGGRGVMLAKGVSYKDDPFHFI